MNHSDANRINLLHSSTIEIVLDGSHRFVNKLVEFTTHLCGVEKTTDCQQT